MPLTKTRSLMADLATAVNLPGLPPDNNGGYEINIGEDTSVLMYGEGDETLLVVAPVCPLPQAPGYALTAWLLGKNMFNSNIQPFCVAADDADGVILWGRLHVDEMTGQSLAAMLGPLAARIKDLRDEMVGKRTDAGGAA